MLVGLQVVAIRALTPLNVTVLGALARSKVRAGYRYGCPHGAGGRRLVADITAGTVIVNGIPLLARSPAVTTTLPVVAPLGTGITMLVELQLVAVPAEVPLNVTVLAA